MIHQVDHLQLFVVDVLKTHSRNLVVVTTLDVRIIFTRCGSVLFFKTPTPGPLTKLFKMVTKKKDSGIMSKLIERNHKLWDRSLTNTRYVVIPV